MTGSRMSRTEKLLIVSVVLVFLVLMAAMVRLSFILSGGWTPTPTMHFRHNGNTAIAWADGHADFNGSISYGKYGDFGWFGGESADEVMELFRLRKTK